MGWPQHTSNFYKDVTPSGGSQNIQTSILPQEVLKQLAHFQ